MNCLNCKVELDKQKKYCSKRCQGIFNRKEKNKCVGCNSELRTGKKYCSLECRDKSYQKIVSFFCEQCGKEVKGASGKTQAHRRRFCSQDCVLVWKRIAYCGRKVEYIVVNCDFCGKELKERKPSKVNNKNYCDGRCRSSYMWEYKNLKDVMIFKRCFAKTSKGIIKFRSMWEAAFVIDFLDKNKLQWEYESQTFTLSDGRNYTPDFHILDNDNDCYVEIKGFDKSNSTQKVYMFRKEQSIPIILANEQVLKNIYRLNLDNKYLKTICTTKEGQPLSMLSS